MNASTDGSRRAAQGGRRALVAAWLYHRSTRAKGARAANRLCGGDRRPSSSCRTPIANRIRANIPIFVDPIPRARPMWSTAPAPGRSAHRVLYFWHRVGNGVLTLVSNMFTNVNLTDMETGYKAFRRECWQRFTIEEIGLASSRESPPRSPRSNAGSRSRHLRSRAHPMRGRKIN